MKNETYIKDTYRWEDLLAVVHKLRAPDGCPWDRVQTYESMKKCVADEAGEVIAAVDNGDFINLREELGDLLLQVLMYAEIARDRGEFTLDDVIDELAKKLVRRHPHVFGEETADTPAEGISKWNAVKLEEKKNRLSEYEKMYREGRISADLVRLARAQYEAYVEKIGIFNKK